MNKQELIDALIESAKRGDKFDSMTNEELADFLMNEVWANMGLFSPESDLIQALIDRLRGEN